jgi:hypothetical protein
MGDLVMTVLLFFGVMAITAVVFGGWILVGIFRFFTQLVAGRPPQIAQQSIDGRLCVNEQCKAINAVDAKSCRRCGREMPAPQRVEVRRAAML